MRAKYIKRLLHSVRYGLLSSLWPRITYLLVVLGGVRFSAFLCSLTIDWGEEKSGPLILCPFRESFIKDIYELRKRTNFQFAVVMGGVTRFQKPWFPLEMQTQTFYQVYRGHNYSKALRKSYFFAYYLIQFIQRKKKVDAVLSANFDYWQEAGLKKVCKDKNIPFVVLSREHPVVPYVCDLVADWYVRSGYTFEGDEILVAGQSSKDVLFRVGSVCPDNKVIVTGLPRFDAWRDIDYSHTENTKVYVTLLTFTEGYCADLTFLEVLKLFTQSAANFSDSNTRFLIKTKDANDNFYIEGLIPDHLRSFVEVSFERDLFDVLPKSKCVIGYNSLSMVEAIMAGSKLIVPAWGECLDAGPKVMYPADDPVIERLITFAYSSDEFVEAIKLTTTSPQIEISQSHRDQFVSKYIHIPGEYSSSEAVAKRLNDLIFKMN